MYLLYRSPGPAEKGPRHQPVYTAASSGHKPSPVYCFRLAESFQGEPHCPQCSRIAAGVLKVSLCGTSQFKLTVLDTLRSAIVSLKTVDQ